MVPDELDRPSRVPASDMLFLDDQEPNVVAARAVGMSGVVIRTAEDVLAATAHLLDHPITEER